MKKIEFKWWQWIFYVLGWVFGVGNLLFWMIMSGLHLTNNYGDPFFNNDFHRRVYVWGIVTTSLFLVAILFLTTLSFIPSSYYELDYTISDKEISSQVICSYPYIENGTGCCLDATESGICDEYELEIEKEIRKDYFSNTDRLHFGQMPVTFGFKTECWRWIFDSVRLAFESIEKETDGVVHFKEVEENPDISIYCVESEYDRYSDTTPLGGAVCILDNDNPNLIIGGEITIYGQGFSCSTGYPALEIHEILHVFGFLHNPSRSSIMYRFSAYSSNECRIDSIDQVYIDCLRNIYSNGTIPGDCSKINTVIRGDDPPLCYTEEEFYSVCADGWYPATNAEYCCSEPNMFINEDGYCSY